MSGDVHERPRVRGRTTEFGFDWGAASVTRACEFDGHVVIMITTPRQHLDVRVTPTGLIRIDGPVVPNKRGHP